MEERLNNLCFYFWYVRRFRFVLYEPRICDPSFYCQHPPILCSIYLNSHKILCIASTMKTFDWMNYKHIYFRENGYYDQGKQWSSISIMGKNGEALWTLTYHDIDAFSNLLTTKKIPPDFGMKFGVKLYGETEDISRFLLNNKFIVILYLGVHDLICKFSEEGISYLQRTVHTHK